MKLHDLKPRPGSHRRRKRVGRGISAGQGKTAGRGMKGQGARAGSGGNIYRQGGSLPLFRRLPFKRGFTNINRITWAEVNLDQLAKWKASAEVNPESLVEAGLLDDLDTPVVVLGRGDVKKALKIRVHRVTSGARKKVEKAGGSVELIEIT
jgi:large subunit ribosomal protein L15